jgi:gas vesicle protein
MKGSIVGPLTTGVMLGVMASLVVLPQMDSRTRRKICKTSRKFASGAENLFHDLTDH